MLHSLTGRIERLPHPLVSVHVSGVGYLVTVTSPVWDVLADGATATLLLHPYIREDRFDLFGFLTKDDRAIFGALLQLSGIGPKTALEICSIPRHLLLLSVRENDAKSLTKIKGVGSKTAEKLLVDLRQLVEKHPEWSVSLSAEGTSVSAAHDDDAIAALASLGYDRPTIIAALQKLSPSIKTTEERVSAALRSL